MPKVKETMALSRKKKITLVTHIQHPDKKTNIKQNAKPNE